MKRARCSPRAGFTLVEIMAAMAVLVVLVLVMSALFGQATQAWTRGESQVTIYEQGRSFVDQVARDLSTALADEVVSFASFKDVAQGAPSTVDRADGMYMVVIKDSPVFSGTWNPKYMNRNLSIVEYVLQRDPVNDRGRIVRADFAINPVTGTNWNLYQEQQRNEGTYRNILQQISSANNFETSPSPYQGVEVLLQNVYSFEIKTYPLGKSSEVSSFCSDDYAPDYYPARVDVKAIVLSDDDWARSEVYSAGEWKDYAEKNGVVFQTSANFLLRGQG